VVKPLPLLTERLQAAIAAALGPEHAGTDPVLRRSQQARFGDYQANVAMALARRVGHPPREVALAIVDHLDAGDLCSKVEVAGPGFVNLTLRDDVLDRAASELAADDRLGVSTDVPARTVVIDYSSPNLAKEMHVGHLRSTIIGDALARTLEFLGHRVIRQNHFGDWGTQFGMLVEHLADRQQGAGAHSIADLNVFYQEAATRFRDDPAFAERARKRVVALQGGDQATLAIWRDLVAESKRHVQEVYDRLGVTLTDADSRGESFYNDMLDDVAADLEAAGLASIDQGALCAFPPGFTNREGEPLPLIVRKADGGYGYAATDLAAIRFRLATVGAERLVYVVGAPQTQHFAMVFAVARQAGWLPEGVDAEHVAFGTILGADGRPYRTRTGENVRLTELLDEAERRAAVVVAEKNPDLDPATRDDVARMVGIGAVKYADLSNDRLKDYVFDFDRMLAMDGNTAPYLQYAHARIKSIFRRGADVLADVTGPVAVREPPERALVLQLLGLESVAQATAESLQPHRLCTYLFELASSFTNFYERCPVLRAADEETRASRLVLCRLTAAALALGLGLLGIEAPERM
jgi:arginyl-tRNA synthetase